ncbi:MAG: hypothetical protein JWP93_293 [Polaromonas sp.]|jgi:hypothetical protein|nr:hypothetical protein [Polaromonas sp.]
MIKITGLDEFSKKLDNLDGKHVLSLDELLTPEFVSKHTRFANADEMFDASGFEIRNSDDFAAVPDDKWDEFICSVSSFSDWEAMQAEAGSAWAIKRLGL